jgi:hypothetical protein
MTGLTIRSSRPLPACGLQRQLASNVIPALEPTDDTNMATTLRETLAQFEALGNEKVRAQILVHHER